jgi:hypothetical protein
MVIIHPKLQTANKLHIKCAVSKCPYALETRFLSQTAETAHISSENTKNVKKSAKQQISNACIQKYIYIIIYIILLINLLLFRGLFSYSYRNLAVSAVSAVCPENCIVDTLNTVLKLQFKLQFLSNCSFYY